MPGRAAARARFLLQGVYHFAAVVFLRVREAGLVLPAPGLARARRLAATIIGC